MKLLAIETSSSPASIALFEPGNLNKEVQLGISHSTSVTLLPAIIDLLNSNSLLQKDLDAIAVAVGPGSYTGTRVGMATAQGIAEALNIPIHEVSSLAGLASQTSVKECPIAVIRRTTFPKLSAKKFADESRVLFSRNSFCRNAVAPTKRFLGPPAKIDTEYFFCIFESLEQLDKKIIEEDRYKVTEIIEKLKQLNRPCHLLVEADEEFSLEEVKGLSVETVMPSALNIGKLVIKT